MKTDSADMISYNSDALGEEIDAIFNNTESFPEKLRQWRALWDARSEEFGFTNITRSVNRFAKNYEKPQFSETDPYSASPPSHQEMRGAMLLIA